ncbi:MAG: hypothetical protein MPJ22_01505 [Pirellulales bacterium]|nr:hypothetical protein [Pirellulales bacterium]
MDGPPAGAAPFLGRFPELHGPAARSRYSSAHSARSGPGSGCRRPPA